MPVGFGPKNAWLAVPSVSAMELADALGIAALEPADWSAGVDFAYDRAERGVFITPPLRQWTLCVGGPVFVDRKGFAAELSARLGGREVQHFGTHRVSEGHFWERAIGGRTMRYFREYDGEQQQDGELTQEELACGFKINLSDAELAALDDGDDGWDDYWIANENFVFALAGAWSIDPSMIEEEFPDVGPGFIGRTAPQPSAAEATESARPVPPTRSNWIRSVWGALKKKRASHP